MVAVFKSDERWKILSKTIIMQFESRYSLRLYEMLSLRKGFGNGKVKFTIEDLRARLGVDNGKLSTFSNFRTRCLDAAIAEVIKVTGAEVSYTPIKRGNAVIAIELTWTDPIAAVMPAKLSKLSKPAPPSSPKATRTAKSKPPATTSPNPTSPSLAFPAKGEARAIEPWASLMRQLAPSYKIAGALESGFRTAMLQEGTALDAPDIQERFRTYVAERYEMFREKRKAS